MFALFHAAFIDLANVNLSLLTNFYHVLCVAVVKHMTSGPEVAIQMTKKDKTRFILTQLSFTRHIGLIYIGN